MERTVDGLVEEARRLSLPEQLALIERLAQSLQSELEGARALRGELITWDVLSDEALANFEKGL
jgi:hypothetical protein